MNIEQITGGVRMPSDAYMEWALRCRALIDRYRDVPDAKVIERLDRGRMHLHHIQLPSGEMIPFPPQPEEIQ